MTVIPLGVSDQERSLVTTRGVMKRLHTSSMMAAFSRGELFGGIVFMKDPAVAEQAPGRSAIITPTGSILRESEGMLRRTHPPTESIVATTHLYVSFSLKRRYPQRLAIIGALPMVIIVPTATPVLRRAAKKKT